VSAKYKLTIRLDPETDVDLLTWIDDLKRRGYGTLSREIKAALRAAHHKASALDHSGSAGSDLHAFLQEVRQVVEAAVTSALDGVTVPQSTPRIPHAEEDTTALLDALDEHLLLDEEVP